VARAVPAGTGGGRSRRPAAVTRNRARLEHLAARSGPRVLAYLARRTETPADAADLYQEVLVLAWRRLERIPLGDDDALGWLLATARRCLANHRRGAVRRTAATQRLADSLVVGAPVVDHDDGALRYALDRLPAEVRELVTLVYWDELTCDQAAAVIGIKPPAARKRLERARQRLRLDLEDNDNNRASCPSEGGSKPCRTPA
jgi:RNA polymerase sigma factor (sigma-70 family)